MLLGEILQLHIRQIPKGFIALITNRNGNHRFYFQGFGIVSFRISKYMQIRDVQRMDKVKGFFKIFIRFSRKTYNHIDAKICSCDISEVSGFNASFSQNDRTRTFLKVQDGCDYNCSFCTIPMARGKSRSDSIANVIMNAEKLALVS